MAMSADASPRVVLYVRVSTDGQTVANQEQELREVATAKGWEVEKVYRDEGVSGAKGREARHGLDQMLKDAVRGRFSVLMAWSVDRLGRSLQDLIHTLNDLRAAHCDLYLHRQALDTRTPSGRAMFQMLGVFAEFEREMIRERVKSGIERARRTGTKSGRAIGRPKVSIEIERKVRALRRRGYGLVKIGRELRVGTRTAQRIVLGK
jgi:DNA invertase Pin-like site-specific DNA recombinase